MRERGWTLVAVLVAGLVLGAPAVAADTDVDQRIGELERELESLKREVASEEDETVAEEAEELPDVAADDGGLFPTWHLTKALTFTPAMRIQTRYSYSPVPTGGLPPGDPNPDHRFQLRRFRLKGKGDILNVAKYYTELKVDGTGFVASPTAAVENAWIEFNRLPRTNLRIGLYDIPFSRNALTSDSKLLFMNRSVIKAALTAVGFADNTIGALFHEIIMDGRLAYGAGIFQNNVFKEVPTVAGRLTLHLLDKAKPQGSRGSYANYRGSYIGEGRRLDIGANAAYTPDAHNAVGNYDVYAAGGDAFFNTGPFTLQGEYDWFKQSGRGVTTDIETKGGFVQAAVMLNSFIERFCSSKWVPPMELAARYQNVDSGGGLAIPDLGLMGTFVGTIQAGEVGMNFYIRDHNLKVQTNYTYADFEGSGTSNIYQLQLQLDF